MTSKIVAPIFCALLLQIFLAGCTPGMMAFSPQQAALQAATERVQPDAVIDQSTLQVRQTVPIDNQVFVVITYSQRDNQFQSKCLMVYQTQQRGIGSWTTGGGGGGCSGSLPGEEPAPPVPVELGGGTNGGNGPNDPGYSHAAGMVNQADIVRVRLTWNDGQQTEAPVINNTYLTIRPGALNFLKIEGLNANGDVVFMYDTQEGPGNQ